MTKDERWTEGRDRHVRVYLTKDEHALVRQAAARVDKSVSRFSVESIVNTARVILDSDAEPAAEPIQEPSPAPEPKPRGRPRKAPAEGQEPQAEKPARKARRKK